LLSAREIERPHAAANHGLAQGDARRGQRLVLGSKGRTIKRLRTCRPTRAVLAQIEAGRSSKFDVVKMMVIKELRSWTILTAFLLLAMGWGFLFNFVLDNSDPQPTAPTYSK
jgi:hypothetical protein